MNSKIFWLSVLAIIISFFGGFYLANSLNGNELVKLRAENEQLKNSSAENPPKDSDGTLTDDEIRQKIAEADKNPGNLAYQRSLGLALLTYGAMKQNVDLITESTRLLQRAHDGNPQDFDVIVALGNAYYDIASLKNDVENFKKSREYYTKALDLKPDNASVRADFGSTFVFVNPPDFERAGVELQKALQTDPKNERALLLMTQTLIKQNKQAEAEKYLTKLREVNPKAPSLAELNAQMAREAETIQK
jgi:tetratricopeptide (TPR) repeat protein